MSAPSGWSQTVAGVISGLLIAAVLLVVFLSATGVWSSSTLSGTGVVVAAHRAAPFVAAPPATPARHRKRAITPVAPPAASAAPLVAR